MIILFKLLAKLPLFILYIFSDIFAFILFRVVRYRREVTFKNLRNSFPEKSDKEIYAVAKSCYKNIADVFVEAIKASDLSLTELKHHVRFVNPELLQPVVDSGQAFILLATHQCNWEWLLLASKNQFDIDLKAIYRPLHNKKYDDYMLASRSKFGVQLIPSKQAVVTLMRERKSLQAIAAVADQSPVEGDDKHWVRCLNQDTPMHVGMEKLAKIMKLPVFFVFMRRVKRGFYEVEIKLIGEPPYEREGNTLTEIYAQCFEQQVLANPEDWAWTNRRWKYKKPVYS